MMILQEILDSMEQLSIDDRDYLVEFIRQRQQKNKVWIFVQGDKHFGKPLKKKGLSLMMKIWLICAIAVSDEKLIYDFKIFTPYYSHAGARLPKHIDVKVSFSVSIGD